MMRPIRKPMMVPEMEMSRVMPAPLKNSGYFVKTK
jgi:hypothetical protein